METPLSSGTTAAAVKNFRLSGRSLGIVALAFALLGPGSRAFADTILKTLMVQMDVRAKTRDGMLTWRQEYDILRDELDKENAEELANGETYVGGTYLNGSLEVASLFGSGPFTVDLTFSWVNPGTALPTSGPAISTVDYYLFTGTSASFDLSTDWTLIGSSSDAATSFGLGYTFPFGEEIFLGVPLNSAGTPIVVDGVGGYNDAQGLAMNTALIPEPSSLCLFGSGLVGLAGVMRRRLRRS